jgi:methyl-accepting chemotaxis protein
VHKLKLLQKFWLVSAIFLLSLIAQITMSLYTTSLINDTSNELIDRNIPILTKAHELKLAVVQVQQFLTDISATRGQDGLDDGLGEAEHYAVTFRTLIKELIKLDPDNARRYQQMLPAFEDYYTTGKTMAKAYVDQGPAGGNRNMPQFDEVADRLAQQVDGFLTDIQSQTSHVMTQQQNSVANARSAFIFGALLTTIIVVIIGYSIRQAIVRIPQLLTAVNLIAAGDLTSDDVPVLNHDEISLLCKDVNTMRNKLKAMIHNIVATSSRLNDHVDEMAHSAEHSRAVAAEEQSDIRQIATAITQMSATALQVAQNAGAAAEAAADADQESGEGLKVVENSVHTIHSLADEVMHAAEVIQNLKADSENIGGILDVIRGIAEQTNLLALNAAIEAARAGDQGRGFAVVADEVRTLALRTQQSTQEIHDMIERLQDGSNNAVDAMDKGKNQAAKSVEEATEAGQRLKSISQAISTITDMNNQIANASVQQSTVAEELNRNITHINDTTEEAFVEANKTSEACGQISSLVKELNDMVVKFKVS